MTSPWQFDRTSDEAPAPDPYAGYLPVPAAEAPPRRPTLTWDAVRGDVIAGTVTLAACLLAAVAVGAIWHAVAPDLPRVVVGHNPYSTAKTPDEGEIARDGWFGIIAAATGLLLALLGFWKGRKHGVGVALGLGLGGLLGAYVAYKVGAALGPDQFWEAVDKKHPDAGPTEQIPFDEPLRLQAMGVLYLWPMVSLVVYVVLMASFGPRDPAPKTMPWPAQGGYGWPTDVQTLAAQTPAAQTPVAPTPDVGTPTPADEPGEDAAANGEGPDPTQRPDLTKRPD